MKRSEPRTFHYMIAELYNLIQQDQLIKPATEHVPPGERPVSWSAWPAMPRHFHEELEALKQTLLAMGGLVEDQIRRVMRALLDRDDIVAQEVIDRDRQVNAHAVVVHER